MSVSKAQNCNTTGGALLTLVFKLVGEFLLKNSPAYKSFNVSYKCYLYIFIIVLLIYM